MSLIRFAALAFIVTLSFASSINFTPSQPIILPTQPADPRSTACGEIIVRYEQTGDRVPWASDVFECLKNVPFDPAVATRFLKYYNQTLQFQSTLAFLKQPPKGYQQPSVDVSEELHRIQHNVDLGLYANQYVFEADVQLVIGRMHDAHVSLASGILAPFTFVNPYGLISASIDGRKSPQVYIRDDIIQSQLEGWTPSPVSHVNDVDVVTYLTEFAEANSQGYIEPHADWNALFENPALDIQGYMSVMQSATFYPGDELRLTFANGSADLLTWWQAIYHEPNPTGPLTTAGDFYNYFVLGLLPASFDPDHPDAQWWPALEKEPVNSTDSTPPATTSSNYGCSNDTQSSWCSFTEGAYPNSPVVSQANLTISGVVTGYLLTDISTAVLSLPSFLQFDDDSWNFLEAVQQFINVSTTQNMQKVVIDLQQNRGGELSLALLVFSLFFPDIDPYTGSRIRSHELADVLGSAFSSWWAKPENRKSDTEYLAASEWIVTNRINDATDKEFTSWKEYYGPFFDHGDAFSAVERYNFTDDAFLNAAFPFDVPYNLSPGSSRWAPGSIVLLTDGLCSSACAYFVELMKHYAGVKTIVVGGRPQDGPMQAASGTRGARSYSAADLDFDFATMNETLGNSTAEPYASARDDTGIFINYAGFNIRDHMRHGDKIPLQFKYEAADCRIFYTLANVHNLTRLWRDAATATWFDSTLCVKNSTGFASDGSNNTDAKAPPPPPQTQGPILNLENNHTNFTPYNATSDITDGYRIKLVGPYDLQSCNQGKTCPSSQVCTTLQPTCSDGKTKGTVSACLPMCDSSIGCYRGMECRQTTPAESKQQPVPKGKGQVGRAIEVLKNGYCVPTVDLRLPITGCPT